MAFPRWLRRSKEEPRTFGEKIRFRMEHDRRDILQVFADKVAVRDYVTDRVGSSFLPVLHDATTDPATIDPTRYPRQFVLKASHGCGGMIIVSDKVDTSTILPPTAQGVGWSSFTVHPDTLDGSHQLQEFSRYWLDQRYHADHQNFEWAYQGITPRILIEEYLEADDDSFISPTDVKFHCFDGRVAFIKHVSGRYTDDIRGDLLTSDWRHLDVEMTQRRSVDPPPRPRHLAQMVEMAESLAAGMDFVRVDLYEVCDRIVFGEMTNYPEAGTAVFRPHSFDEHLGDLWSFFQIPGRSFR